MLRFESGGAVKRLILSAFVFFIVLVVSEPAIAYVDLSLNYHFTQRRIDGMEPTNALPDPGEAVTTTEGWSVNWGWYIWAYTALELNYSQSRERLVDDRATATDDDSITIKEVDSLVKTEVMGVGLRQSFARRKATFIPSIAIGYAKLTTSGETSYTLETGGVEQKLRLDRDTEVYNSSYVTAALRIRFTELIGLSLSAKSVMPDFDTSKASDNLTYSAGFSWVF